MQMGLSFVPPIARSFALIFLPLALVHVRSGVIDLPAIDFLRGASFFLGLAAGLSSTHSLYACSAKATPAAPSP